MRKPQTWQPSRGRIWPTAGATASEMIRPCPKPGFPKALIYFSPFIISNVAWTHNKTIHSIQKEKILFSIKYIILKSQKWHNIICSNKCCI